MLKQNFILRNVASIVACLAVSRESKMLKEKSLEKSPVDLNKIARLFKKLSLIVIAAIVLAGCKKDEIDPTQQKINELTAQEKKLAGEVRAAVEPAVTQPDNIGGIYWGTFNNSNIPPAASIYDSAKCHMLSIDALREVYGDPIPSNNPNLSYLYDKCGTYILVVNELKQLQK